MKQIYFNCLCTDLRRVRKLNERKKRHARNGAEEKEIREKKNILHSCPHWMREGFSGSAVQLLNRICCNRCKYHSIVIGWRWPPPQPFCWLNAFNCVFNFVEIDIVNVILYFYFLFIQFVFDFASIHLAGVLFVDFVSLYVYGYVYVICALPYFFLLLLILCVSDPFHSEVFFLCYLFRSESIVKYIVHSKRTKWSRSIKKGRNNSAQFTSTWYYWLTEQTLTINFIGNFSFYFFSATRNVYDDYADTQRQGQRLRWRLPNCAHTKRY